MTIKRLMEILDSCSVQSDAEVKVMPAIYHESITDGVVVSVEVHEDDDEITLIISNSR